MHFKLVIPARLPNPRFSFQRFKRGVLLIEILLKMIPNEMKFNKPVVAFQFGSFKNFDVF